MEVGDYVRTKNGEIFKWNKYNKIREELEPNFYDEDRDYTILYKNDILKSSPNIIDLIEVGDVVVIINGINEEELILIKDLKKGKSILESHKIKSILTKEQFEEIEYKL